MLRERGQLIGLLPVCRRRGALFSPTNWHTQEFGLLAEPAVVAPELLRQTLANRGGAHRISLSFLDPGRNDLEAWRAAAQAQRFRVLTRPFVRSAHVDICGSWEAYERSLSRNIRSDMRRSLRRLGEAGEVRSSTWTGGRGSIRCSLKVSGSNPRDGRAVRGTAIASSPETELFYREVSAWAAQKGSLRVAFLRLDGRAIAFELAIEEDGVFYALKSGFDPPISGVLAGQAAHPSDARARILGRTCPVRDGRY